MLNPPIKPERFIPFTDKYPELLMGIDQETIKMCGDKQAIWYTLSGTYWAYSHSYSLR